MNIILGIILVVLIILIILVIILLGRIKSFPSDMPANIDASLSKQFLNFQTDIHRELGMTKGEVERSKDIIQ